MPSKKPQKRPKMKSANRTQTTVPSAGRVLVTGVAALAIAALGGCATYTGGLGDETGTVRLPAGSELKDSSDHNCGGTLQIGDASTESPGLRDEFFVERGDNATYRLVDEKLSWACTTTVDSERYFGNTECPSGSEYARVTRAATGSEFLIECYGG